MMRYTYFCLCGVSIEAPSDKDLEIALQMHEGSSQIHLKAEHEAQR